MTMSREMGVLKAELQARASSRKLEHGIEHLGDYLEDRLGRVEAIRSRANHVVDQVKDPRALIARSARSGMDSVRQGVERIPPDYRGIVVGVLSGVLGFLGLSY